MSGPHARTTVRRDHAVIAPETHVPGPVPGWSGAEHVRLIAPPMGARFSMSLVRLEAGGVAGPPPAGVARVVYMLEGGLLLQAGGEGNLLGPGGYAYVPAGSPHTLSADTASRAVVLDKPYHALPGVAPPGLVVGHAADRPSEPMLGDPALLVRQLLPEEPSFDLAVNLMAFAPGAALPFVETHVMEHGLLVLEGSFVYRLGDDWYPVTEGDAIWMGPFCPQWACAHGPGRAEYLIYKDWNRDVIA